MKMPHLKDVVMLIFKSSSSLSHTTNMQPYSQLRDFSETYRPRARFRLRSNPASTMPSSLNSPAYLKSRSMCIRESIFRKQQCALARMELYIVSAPAIRFSVARTAYNGIDCATASSLNFDRLAELAAKSGYLRHHQAACMLHEQSSDGVRYGRG